MSIISAATNAFSSDSLQKIQIDHEVGAAGSYTGQIKAMFNPAQLKFAKEVSWDLSPVAGQHTIAGYHRLSFRDSKPTTLAIELFFDTYEGPPAEGGEGIGGAIKSSVMSTLSAFNPLLPDVSGVAVTTYTQKVAQLACLDAQLHRPPRCKLRWGKFTLLEGVLTSLSEDYTFFLPDGTPVRATLNCAFTEVIDESSTKGYSELHSADVAKQWIVKRGDTLSSIAQASYGDASKWRVIAQANELDDPRRLPVGRLLAIPKLPSRG